VKMLHSMSQIKFEKYNTWSRYNSQCKKKREC
jgi:hypothetical protein